MESAARIRQHPVARRVVASYRRLIVERGSDGGGGVVVACSGGVDSVALALMLGTARAVGPVTAAYIRHDARSRGETDREVEAVSGLAAWLGIGFATRDAVAGSGASEGVYRDLRYGLLCEIASGRGAAAVVTGHHAEDQLETLIAALARGAGPRGMRGIAACRSLGRGIILVRPMLRVTRSEARSVCGLAGVGWCEDPTNADPRSNLRASIRARVAGPLLDVRPEAARRAAAHAELMRDVSGVVRDRAREVAEAARVGLGEFDRAVLRRERPVVIAEVLRMACERGGGSLDRFGHRKARRIGEAVRGSGTDPKRFEISGGYAVLVESKRVAFERPQST